MTSSPLREVAATPSALYLLVASLIGRLPTAMAALAIVQLVRLQGGGFALAGVMTALYIVVGAVGQPLLSRLVDRSGRTVVLVASAVLSSIAFVVVAQFAASAPVVGAIAAAVAGFFGPPLEPSLRSLWPRIVPEGRALKAAFSLDAGAQELMYILGPLLTVVGIAAFGATGNLVFAAALGLVGTLAFAINPVSRRVHADEKTDAARVNPWTAPGFARLVVFTFAVGLPVGVLTIAATAFEESSGVIGFGGWALALNAGGALLGATVLALRPLTASPYRAIAACGALLAVGYLPLVFDLPWPVWLVAAVVAGVMLPPTLGQVFECVARVSAASGLNEANAWIVSAMNVGVAAGTLGGGWLAAVPGVAVAAAVVLTLVGASIVLPLRRR